MVFLSKMQWYVFVLAMGFIHFVFLHRFLYLFEEFWKKNIGGFGLRCRKGLKEGYFVRPWPLVTYVMLEIVTCHLKYFIHELYKCFGNSNLLLLRRKKLIDLRFS
jgi:hypothetical protein